MSGSKAVVHGAGAVRGNSQDDFDRVNVIGTAALLEVIAVLPSPPRILLLSSLAAREPQLSWYAHSKREGEQQLEKYPRLDWVILRPPAVYGPGDREMLPLFQAMSRGIALVPGSPDARTSLVHVSDLVTAITACLASTEARQHILYPSDGTASGYSWRDMAAIAGQIWDRPVRLWQVPSWLLNSVARLNSAIARFTGRAPMLTPPKLRELRHTDWVVDSTDLTRTTEWRPQTGLLEGLEQLKNPAL